MTQQSYSSLLTLETPWPANAWPPDITRRWEREGKGDERRRKRKRMRVWAGVDMLGFG